MKKYKYKFSIVMPIYNTEQFLEETLESVYNQSLDFEQNVQLILINDGSSDNSGEICKEQYKKYPNNITYLEQKNAGVSAARNNGIEHIEGKYVYFLDSDDLIHKDTLKKSYDIFEKHEEIDVIGLRIRFFDAVNRFHQTDFKFTEDRVIDLDEEYDAVHIHIGASLIRHSAINDLRFDPKLKYGEDTKFLLEIVCKKRKYFALRSCPFLYRKRGDFSSAIQEKNDKPEWFTNTPEFGWKYLFDLSIKEHGYVLPLLQSYLVYELRYRINVPKAVSVTNEEYEKYKQIVRELINQVEEKYILETRLINFQQKLILLSYKNKTNVEKLFKLEHDAIIIKNLEFPMGGSLSVVVDYLKIENQKLYLYGRKPKLLSGEEFGIKFINETNNKEYKAKIHTFVKFNDNSDFLEEYYFKNDKIAFEIEIPLEANMKLSVHSYNKKESIKNKYYFSPKSHLNNVFASLYYVKNNYILKYDKMNSSINVHNNKFSKRFVFAIKCFFNLLKKRKFTMIIYRVWAKVTKIFKRKEIWILSDRVLVGDDNGEHFFKYLNKNHPEIKSYFLLSKDSKDIERIKSIGKVLTLESFKMRLMFIIADKIVSSQADEPVINPIGSRRRRWLTDIIDSKFIFLQHGVIDNKDLSPWLNINNKPMDIFITSTQKEYKSILDNNYNYGKDIVKLTGLARFDNLLKKDVKLKKQFLIMLTWRAYLAGPTNPKTGEKVYNKTFKNTEFFKFYNNLINDKRIIESLKEHNYECKFYLHPNAQSQIPDFDTNEYVSIVKNINYQQEFKENKFLITDYSSTVFDFLYLKKPIAYLQFDYDEFFNGQIYGKTESNFEKDGLGPVYYDYESSVKGIIRMIETDGQMEKKYQKNVNSLFKYNDNKNCKRIFDEIKKIDERK